MSKYQDDCWLAQKLVGLRDRCKNKGIEFDLSFAHLKRIYRRKTCYYTGRKLTEKGRNQRSIERIDSDKGYTDDNTIIISKHVNQVKNDLTLKELENMVKQIKKHKNK